MSAAIDITSLESVSGPKQARSERTLLRLLDSAEALINERGLAGLSIPEVVRRAKSSVGGFYARFRDKNELLRALEERFFRELDVRVDALLDLERWQDVPTSVVIDAAVAELVAVVRERQQLVAAFLFRAIQDSAIRDEGVAFRQQVSERVRDLLLRERFDEFNHPDPELALDLAVQAAFSFMQQHVLLGETRSGNRLLSDADLTRELARLVRSYVGIAEDTPPNEDMARRRS